MLTLVHCDPETNKHRFYSMHLQPDLLGGVGLVLEFGRIGQPDRVIAVATCNTNRSNLQSRHL